MTDSARKPLPMTQRLSSPIQAKILSFLDEKDHCRSMVPVCKPWKVLARESKHAWPRTKIAVNSADELVGLQKAGCPIEELELLPADVGEMAECVAALPWLPALRSLEVAPALKTLESDREWASFLPNVLRGVAEYGRLQALTLHSTQPSPRLLRTIERMTSLTSLRVPGLLEEHGYRRILLDSTLDRLRNLRELEVADLLTAEQLRRLTRRGVRVRSLVIDVQLSGESAATLRDLLLVDVRFESRADPAILAALPASIERVSLPTHNGQFTRAAVAALSALPKLTALRVSCGHDQPWLPLVAQAAPGLKSLDIGGDVESTLPYLALLTRLESLRLQHFLDNKVAAIVAASVPSLTRLDLGGCFSITVCAKLTRLTRLRSLSMRVCDGASETRTSTADLCSLLKAATGLRSLTIRGGEPGLLPPEAMQALEQARVNVTHEELTSTDDAGY